MDAGGLAVTVVGAHGDGVRGDARITVSPSETFQLEVRSSVESMYGRAIRAQASDCLRAYGNPSLQVLIEDSGALPYVLQARLEAALSQHLGVALPPIEAKPVEPVKTRLRRTRLYVPGNTPKFIVNAGLYEADGVILDLEDSVPDGEKASARALVRRALQVVDFGRSEKIVRVNSGAQGLADIEALTGADIFLLPKVEAPSEIAEIERLLDRTGSKALLIALLESAKGIHFAYDIAISSPRIVGLALGIEDYAADIRAVKTEEGQESAWAHGQVVNAARAAGVSPFASVFATIDDDAKMEAYAAKMARLGFDGVGCIHPRQIRPAHRGFAPSDAELEKAQAIVAQFDAGAIRVDGQMVDAPIYKRALRTLELGAGK